MAEKFVNQLRMDLRWWFGHRGGKDTTSGQVCSLQKLKLIINCVLIGDTSKVRYRVYVKVQKNKVSVLTWWECHCLRDNVLARTQVLGTLGHKNHAAHSKQMADFKLSGVFEKSCHGFNLMPAVLRDTCLIQDLVTIIKCSLRQCTVVRWCQCGTKLLYWFAARAPLRVW